MIIGTGGAGDGQLHAFDVTIISVTPNRASSLGPVSAGSAQPSATAAVATTGHRSAVLRIEAVDDVAQPESHRLFELRVCARTRFAVGAPPVELRHMPEA